MQRKIACATLEFLLEFHFDLGVYFFYAVCLPGGTGERSYG